MKQLGRETSSLEAELKRQEVAAQEAKYRSPRALKGRVLNPAVTRRSVRPKSGGKDYTEKCSSSRSLALCSRTCPGQLETAAGSERETLRSKRANMCVWSRQTEHTKRKQDMSSVGRPPGQSRTINSGKSGCACTPHGMCGSMLLPSWSMLAFMGDHDRMAKMFTSGGCEPTASSYQ